MGGGVVRDHRDSSGPVNLPVAAVLTGHNHLVPKCARGASMVERNPGMVRRAAWDRRKQRGDGIRWPDLPDLTALCDENVALSEPCVDGLHWSDSHVFFEAGAGGARDRRQHRDIPEAVDRVDICRARISRAPFGHKQIGFRSGHAYGSVATGVADSGKGSCIGGWQIGWMRKWRFRRVDSGKGIWIGGVKDSCQRL